MGFYRGPNIVRSGLKLHLDVESVRSYPGNGTTITNLVDKETFTMGSGITVTNGYMNFDNTTNGHIDLAIGYVPANYTKSMWFRTSVISAENLMSSADGDVLYLESGQIQVGNNWSTTTLLVTTTYNDSIWHLVDVTFDGTTGRVYKDGIFLDEGPLDAVVTTNIVKIGMYDTNWNWNGDMGNIKLYNRALTADEITQNYNALKNRYGR